MFCLLTSQAAPISRFLILRNISIFSFYRRILYYILNILCPCIWLNILSLLAFCLPPDAGEKITLGITVLLSYSVFMLLVAESMPPTSEFVPLIGESSSFACHTLLFDLAFVIIGGSKVGGGGTRDASASILLFSFYCSGNN